MVTHLFMQSKQLKQIFKWPALIGALTAVGLIEALLDEGLLERISLVALSIPIAVIIYFYYYRN
jgi:di/tricarboxylate transporter